MKNKRGERVLDTLVKADHPNITVSSDRKQLVEFSIRRAPSIEVIREYLRKIIKGRIIIGYHFEMQMKELGILDELDTRTPNQTYFDVAKMFNPDPISGQQHRMEVLCKDQLNLAYKKPSKASSHPFAVITFLTKLYL